MYVYDSDIQRKIIKAINDIEINNWFVIPAIFKVVYYKHLFFFLYYM